MRSGWPEFASRSAPFTLLFSPYRTNSPFGHSVTFMNNLPGFDVIDPHSCSYGKGLAFAPYTASPLVCSHLPTAIFPDPPTSYAAQALHGTVPVIDMTSLICEPAVCPPVAGNVLIYFDSHHMTQAFSSTLAPYLKVKLLAAMTAVRTGKD